MFDQSTLFAGGIPGQSLFLYLSHICVLIRGDGRSNIGVAMSQSLRYRFREDYIPLYYSPTSMQQAKYDSAEVDRLLDSVKAAFATYVVVRHLW